MATGANLTAWKQWVLGAQFGFAGFTVGGAVGWDNNGSGGNYYTGVDNDTRFYTAGVMYETGPWQMSFMWAGFYNTNGNGSSNATSIATGTQAMTLNTAGCGFNAAGNNTCFAGKHRAGVRLRDHQQVGNRCQLCARTGRQGYRRRHAVYGGKPGQSRQRQQLGDPARYGPALLVASLTRQTGRAGESPLFPFVAHPRFEEGCLPEPPAHKIESMVRSQAPVPEGIKRTIANGRYREAADALRDLVRREPSVAVLVALADMNLQLGYLTEAKENALTAVAADPQDHSARVLLARVRTALDERDAALADFRAALELARAQTAPANGGPIALPAHQALHNLEQLIYLEQVDNLAPGTLLPVAAGLREVAQRRLNQMLDDARGEIPQLPWAANTVACWPIRRL